MKKFFGLITFIATLGLLFGTSFAKEASFYGNARTGTFFTDYEKENSGITGKTFDTAEHGLYASSRFGVKVKDGDKFANFEINSDGDIRHLYGTVKVGPGNLIVGQTWTPASTFFSNQAYGDDGFGSAGNALSKRVGQISYSVGNFKIGLVDPTKIAANKDANLKTTSANPSTGVITTTTDYKVRADLPAIEFIYSQNFNPIDFTVFGGVNSVELKSADGVEASDVEVDSSLFGLQVQATFGPAMVGFNVYQGTNLSYYPTGGVITSTDPFVTSPAKVEDTTTLGASVVASYKVTDTFGVEAGYAMLTSENDKWIDKNTGKTVDDDSASMYIQFPVTVADGFVVTPEYGVYDYKDGYKDSVTAKQGKMTYFGVKCQLDF